MRLQFLHHSIVCIGAASLMLSLVSCDQSNEQNMKNVPRISSYVTNNTDHQIYVGWPLDMPTRWEKAVVINKTLQIDGVAIDPLKISSFLVVYPNGEVLDTEHPIFPLPEGVVYLEQSDEPVSAELDPSILTAEASLVKITFGPASSRPNEPGHYSTSLQNISDVKLRVNKFAAFSKSGNSYILNTVNRAYFSAEQFIAWYGVSEDGWIKPGQTVSDPNNYGGGDGYWVYYCETDTGTIFTVGAKIPAK